MLYALFGIIVGVIAGLIIDLPIPLEFTRYTAVIIIGMFDALFGALRAEISRKDYNSWIFVSGVVFNILLAMGITLLGDRLGLDLYLAATFVFTFRIFSNLGIIRRAVMNRYIGKKSSTRTNRESSIVTDILD